MIPNTLKIHFRMTNILVAHHKCEGVIIKNRLLHFCQLCQEYKKRKINREKMAQDGRCHFIFIFIFIYILYHRTPSKREWIEMDSDFQKY